MLKETQKIILSLLLLIVILVLSYKIDEASVEQSYKDYSNKINNTYKGHQ